MNSYLYFKLFGVGTVGHAIEERRMAIGCEACDVARYEILTGHRTTGYPDDRSHTTIGYEV